SFWPWRARAKLRRDYLRADVTAIQTIYRHYGFLETEVEYRVATAKDPEAVDVTFVIHEGARSMLRNVELAGVTAYTPAEVRKKLLARTGRAFDPAYLQLDTLRISELYQEKGFRPHVAASMTRDSLHHVDVSYAVREGPQ